MLKEIREFIKDKRHICLLVSVAAYLLSAAVLLIMDKISVEVMILILLTGGLVILPNFKIKLPFEIPGWVYRIGTVAHAALIADITMQTIQSIVFQPDFLQHTVINYFLYCLIFGVICLLFSDWFWGMLTADVFILIWSITNYYLMEFRSRPLFFADFFSVKTAAAVAGEYNFLPGARMLTVSLFFIAACTMMLVTIYRSDLARPLLRPAIRYAVSGAALAVTIISLALGIPTKLGLTDNIFSYSYNYMYSFFMAISASHTEPPEGYSPGEIGRLAIEYPSDKVSDFDKEGAPNVIVIMNEAFSDFDVIKELNTNIEVTPFIDSLKENTVRGYTYSSVFGGNTANSEYEFLTGDTMAYIPNGFMPYTTYLKGKYPTLVSSFNDLGYTTLAMHPAAAGNWNRSVVYDFFGFDRTMFIEDFADPRILRSCISDSSDYENMTAQFEAKEKGEKMFIFNITMQNHSSYVKTYDNFKQEVYLTDHPGEFPAVEQYLSLMHESDKAVEELIDYFSSVDEKTIICFFGDHQPGVGDDFYRMLYGKPIVDLSVEELQRRYMSPFFIWANYDIEEHEDVRTSLNFLSPMMLEAAGLPMTGYQKMLADISHDFPVLSAIGTISADGKHYARDIDPGDERIDKYIMAQYNHLFDSRHRCDELFRLSKGGEEQ